MEPNRAQFRKLAAVIPKPLANIYEQRSGPDLCRILHLLNPIGIPAQCAIPALFQDFRDAW